MLRLPSCDYTFRVKGFDILRHAPEPYHLVIKGPMLLGWPIKEQMPWVVRLHKRGVFDVEGVCREAWMQGCRKTYSSSN